MSSEQLADGVNPLDAELAATWDVLKGYSGRDTDLGIARRFGGASGAYSLRDIGAMNGRVAKVRRDVDGQGSDPEEDFSANQVSSGALEDWVNGKLEYTLPADVATAAAAYSLRKVKASYGIPTTVINGADGFPTTITSSEQTITGTSFTVNSFTDNSPDSSEATAVNGVYRVSATKGSAASFASSIRIKGLEDGKQYTVKGEFRMVEDTTSGGDSIAQVDISDNTAGTDEDTITTTSTTFVPFFIDAGYNSGGSNNFIDFTVATVGSETGTITAEFRNVQIIENNNSAVRIRRSSDDEEIVVGFDSDNKVSVSSPITATPSGSTTATDLNGFLNKTLSDRFSTVDYPSGIGSDFRKWSALTATSNSFVATTGTFADNTARYNYVLPETLTAAESASTTFRFSGTVDYTASGGTGFNIKQGSNATASSTHDFANLTSTGVGTISSDTFKFSNGDSGDFSFEFTGNGTNDFRSIVFLQSIVSSGSTSISLTNLKFEIIKHGATVHTWYDQAGSNNAVQETTANQPQIASSGTLLVDAKGNPTLDFPNASTSDTHRLETNFVGTNINSLSAYCVCKSDNTNTLGTAAFSQPFTQGTYSSNERFFIAIDKDEANWHLGYGTGLTDLGTPITTNQTLFSINAGTNVTSNINAVQRSTASSQDNALTRSLSFIGGHTSTDAPWDGTISELIYYNSDQTDNRFKIESNINNYYGLYNDANEVTGAFTASGENSFTANGTDGFTIESATADAFAGIELNEKVPNNDVIYISFNADLSVSGTASPTVALRKTSISGTVSSDSPSSGQPAVTQGFNYFGLVCSDADAKFITFLEDANSVSYTISDFRVSRIARNGFVETWYDQSDSGNDATQATAPDQPLIVHNGGQVKNSKGKPALDFVAVADHFDVPILIDNINTASTFVVFERDVNSGNGAIAGQLGSSSSTSRFYTPLFTSSSMYWGYGNSSTKINMGTYDANRTYLASFVTGDTNAEAFLDNVSKGTTAVQSAAIDATNGAIGRHTRSSSAFPLDGQLSEVIYYKTKLQDDVADLNTDINNYYNIY